MEFSIKSGKAEKQACDCVIVGVYESGKLTSAATSIDQASNGFIANVLKHGDMDGKLASTLLLHHVPGIESHRVLLVGLGKNGEAKASCYRKAVSASIKALAKTGTKHVASYLLEMDLPKESLTWKTAQFVESAQDSLYHFGVMKGQAT
ncbi:MAG: aminopeptidase a cyteinylglycinase, partial [Pseudomonadota bacterium]